MGALWKLPFPTGAARESSASRDGTPSTHRGLAEEVIGVIGIKTEIIEDMDGFGGVKVESGWKMFSWHILGICLIP